MFVKPLNHWNSLLLSVWGFCLGLFFVCVGLVLFWFWFFFCQQITSEVVVQKHWNDSSGNNNFFPRCPTCAVTLTQIFQGVLWNRSLNWSLLTWISPMVRFTAQPHNQLYQYSWGQCMIRKKKQSWKGESALTQHCHQIHDDDNVTKRLLLYRDPVGQRQLDGG